MTSDSVLVLFPGALGDCLCFLPTLVALRAAHVGRMCLAAQPAFFDLIRLIDTTTVSIHRREIADLFSTRGSLAPETAVLFGGFARVYSWTGFGDADVARRLAEVTGGQVEMHRFRGMQPGEHAVDYYARCVGVQPAPPTPAIVVDEQWLGDFLTHHGLKTDGFIVMHPGSGAPRKNWEGFVAVARHWRQLHRDAVVILHGPAETERPPAALVDSVAVDGRSLQQVAALLRHSRLYLGNDSGISHLAGVVGARGGVVFGPTDPTGWAPRSERLKVLHAPDACVHCGPERFCTHRLAVGRVVAALESAADSVEA
jgi:ADP-heptose:LPS heptosyltransferase